MKEFRAEDVARDFGHLLKEVQGGPVRLVQGDTAGVLISEEQFEAFRVGAWDRLFATMDAMAAEAQSAGLTDEVLADILADAG